MISEHTLMSFSILVWSPFTRTLLTYYTKSCKLDRLQFKLTVCLRRCCLSVKLTVCLRLCCLPVIWLTSHTPTNVFNSAPHHWLKVTSRPLHQVRNLDATLLGDGTSQKCSVVMCNLPWALAAWSDDEPIPEADELILTKVSVAGPGWLSCSYHKTSQILACLDLVNFLSISTFFSCLSRTPSQSSSSTHGCAGGEYSDMISDAQSLQYPWQQKVDALSKQFWFHEI